MRSSFFLFQSHLDLAHQYFSRLVQAGDIVIDATCGKGRDTLQLCKLALKFDQGQVFAFDVLQEALNATKELLDNEGFNLLQDQIYLEKRCHSSFPSQIQPNQVKLIVYNLGYLPGANKDQTTRVETTLKSIYQAMPLITPGGVISITCYPGHTEGAKEQEALIEFTQKLAPQEWSCCHHRLLNRQASPTLILMQKCLSN